MGLQHAAKVMVMLATVVLSLCLTFQGCAASTRSIDTHLAPSLTQHPALQGIEEELLRVTNIQLNVKGITARRVEILDRVPAREMVFIQTAGGWFLSLSDKTLVPEWRGRVEAMLGGLGDSVCKVDAGVLAEDLTRILVDPDPRYGVTISSRDDIPAEYRSSDVLRDLERSGKSAADVREFLLQKAPSTVHPPVTSCSEVTIKHEFYSWHYFGGEVVLWRVMVRPTPTIQREILAQGVGSFDFYY